MKKTKRRFFTFGVLGVGLVLISLMVYLTAPKTSAATINISGIP